MELHCKDCNKFLGELSKGKIHNKAVILCEKCMEKYKTFESLANFKKGTSIPSKDGMEAFKDLFPKGIFG